MRLRLCLAIMFSALIIGISVFAQENASPDFRDLRWGDPVSKLGDDVVKLISVDGRDVYRKVTEDLSLGSIRATSISYVFFNDKLMGLLIEIRDSDTSRAKEMLKAKYGNPIQESRAFDDASWITNRTVAYLQDRYKNSTIGLISIDIDAEYQAWRKEQAEKDASSW